jgi:hypothetical protein
MHTMCVMLALLRPIRVASIAVAVTLSFSVACSSSPDDAAPAGNDVGHDEEDPGEVGDPDAGPAEPDDASTPLDPTPSDAGAPPGHDGGAVAAACALAQPPHAAQLTYGLHPYASDGLRFVGIGASGISQTIGNAAASAGTHAQDGTFMGFAYSAATDIRLLGRSEAQIAALLDKLASVGFAAWYRKPGSDGWPSYDAAHIHAVYVGVPMKLILRNQVRDWLVGKNGLASHTTYKFHTWNKCAKALIQAELLKHNPAKN